MELNTLTAISPLDGRYRKQVSSLSPFFSEYGLIKFRVKVEIEYFIALSEIPLKELQGLEREKIYALRDIHKNFNERDARLIKDIEKTTNHDVKAVEYFIKDKFDELGISDYKEFIHFGLTSQDINNTATPMLLKEAGVLIRQNIVEVNEYIQKLAEDWNNVSMLARTHGQPASPTTLGKEMQVFSARVENQLKLLDQVPFSGKFGGASGNLNAHCVAYPSIDWNAFADKFVQKYLGLTRSYPTTQIEHYDNLGAYFDTLKRINTILLDFSRDVWQYISMNYFKQKIVNNEVGSSAMPHKVNPIDFENAEGNIGIANAMFEHLSAKLPVSRLQRDLTDSTVLRNVGVGVAHMWIALNSLKKGMVKIELNQEMINADLENNWAVTAEAIQTILRREHYPNPYEALKDLTRTNEKVTEKSIMKFIDGLNVAEGVKEELRKITPYNYTGFAGK